MKEKQSMSKYTKQNENKSQNINPEVISHQISEIDHKIRVTELKS